MVTDEKIRNLAYSIWEKEGHPEGKDVEHYLKAKKILDQQEGMQISELAPTSPVVQLASQTKPSWAQSPPYKRNIRDHHMKK
jgi:hypothetical protein